MAYTTLECRLCGAKTSGRVKADAVREMGDHIRGAHPVRYTELLKLQVEAKSLAEKTRKVAKEMGWPYPLLF